MLVYLLLTLFAYFFAEAQIFPKPEASYKDSDKIIKLTTADDAKISAIYLPNPTAKFTVLISHGNAEDLGTMLPFLKEFHSKGFAIFAYDYHGYGTSTGHPSEKNTYLDIAAAYNYLTQQLKIPPENIILFGRSLGAAVSLHLAAEKPAAGLILESPFLSAFRTVTQLPLFLFDKYNNVNLIKKINMPVLVIHGKNDYVIPFWQGQKIYQLLNSPKSFLWLDAGHNDILLKGKDEYWGAIKKFAVSLN